MFERTIDIKIPSHDGENMQLWIFTLPIDEQTEWERVSQLHESIVNQAVAAGDAKRDNGKIFWKNASVHEQYFESTFHDHLIYLNYWRRYRETLK